MLAADLIVEARRRAGLTQQELAARVGRPQSTIARWERGVHAPSIDTTREIIHACGLELTVGLARYDDSYVSLIDGQLRLSPRERLTSLWRVGGNPFSTLAAFEHSAVRQVLIGRAAGVLHGSPILVDPPELVLVPPDDPENERALEAAMGLLGAEPEPVDDTYVGVHTIEPWLVPDGSRIAIMRRPAGTQGFADLRRDAITIEISDDVHVLVASLLDLIRIAEASPRGDRADTVALRTVLERRRSSTVGDHRAPEEIVASWQRPRI